MRPTALVADPICQEHQTGRGHPERPERFAAVLEGLRNAGLLEKLDRIEPGSVSAKELQLAHTAEYLELAEREIRGGAGQLSTGDTTVSSRSWEVVQRAVGSGFAAVDAVITGRARNAFCLVRPPGHHATASVGMGFCILNNIALAARYAQQRRGIGRVLIIDWDVHHGNGTQDIFYEDGSVFFFSTHQWPLYPGTGGASETGAGAGKGSTMNFPLPAGTGMTAIFPAFEKLAEEMKSFRPELVLISAGFDSRVGDPLGHFQLTDEDFTKLTQFVMELAQEHAGGRVISFLEGGYNLSGLASAAAAHAAALAAGGAE